MDYPGCTPYIDLNLSHVLETSEIIMYSGVEWTLSSDYFQHYIVYSFDDVWKAYPGKKIDWS